MFFTTDYIQILLHLLVFSQEAGGVPTWTTEPSNPSLAFEGDNITLHWTYNLDTTVRTAIFTDLRGGGGGKPIADKLLNNAPEVASEYQTRFRVTSSDTEASMTILGVQRSDSGLYRYEVTDNNPDRGKITSEVTILVQYPASILHISGNQTVNDGDVVTLNCTANGGPAPNINWTKESDISSSGGNPIPNVVQTRDSDNSSASFPLTITGKQDEGNYRCTADNGVGTPASNDVFITVENFRPFKTRLNTSLQNDVVLLNETFNITCSAAQANPPAKYRFYREQELVFDDNSGDGVYTTRVSDRDPQVIYRCIPYNSFGNGSEMNIDVTVHYNPKEVNLTSNATVKSTCEDLWVTFNCNASDANPPVYNYLLFEDNEKINSGRDKMWITNVNKEGNRSYHCEANHTLGTVRSINDVNLTVNVRSSVVAMADRNVTESDNVMLYCNVSGSPEPSVRWYKGGSDFLKAERSLLLNSINRTDTGEYTCEASNECNNASKSLSLNVTFKPENVSLMTNISENRVCLGDGVRFTCTAEAANPPVHSYLLYENQTEVGESSSGTWNKKLSSGGPFNYRCVAINSLPNNLVGTGESANVTLRVNVAPSIERVLDKTVTEGDNVTLSCNPFGSPEPSVIWTSVNSGRNTSAKTWNIINITRADAGEYKCEATNECGNDTRSVIVTVHFKPDNVSLVTNISENKVCKGDVVRFTCRAEAANPSVHSYRLYENQTEVGESSSGTWNKKLFSGGYFTYRCVAINSLPNNLVGTGESSNVTLRVNVAPSIEPVASTNVTEGDDVVLFCNASGSPEPSVIWTHVNSGRNKTAKTWNITNINRADAGKYKCEASNECEKVNRSATVTVHYPPNITKPKTGPIGLLAGSTVDIICNADGNPQPSITWINASGAVVGSGGNLSFNLANESYNGFTYICTAENGIEPNASTNITLVVGGNLTTIIIRILDDYYPEYKNVSSNESKVIIGRIQNWLRLIPEINNTAVAIIVTKLSNGSVIAEVLLKFKQIVHIASLLSAIRDAAKNGSIGDLNVDPDSIALVPEPTSTSSPSTTPTTIPAAAPKTTPKNKTSDFPWWILGVAVGGLILLAIVIAIVAWCIHKKRKCRRKDTRVHSENEAQPLEEFSNGTPNGENAENNNAQVNHGYAKSGPAPTNENNEGAAGASAVPPVTYAVVDKSKKNEKPPEYAAVDKSKKKKKKSAANEEKPPEDQYAVVNKSQKKKKPEEPEQQYAQVDRSMKKKHAKPGEVLYADLGEFHGNNSLPKVSTSPEPLPPIKKPTAYVDTQYADITQFLKGDATLPSSDGTGGVTPAAQGQPTAGAQVGTGGAAATSPGEEAGGGSSHVSKL